MDSGKKFGLIIPKKSGLSKPKAKSVFENESDDDDSSQSKRPIIPQKKISLKTKIKEEAIDPSIYEYDNIYDDMKAKQAESIAPKAKQSSRYIDTLLKAADKRKKEYERRVERKIQVEREKEGDQFKDKEEFVTAAYKQKMLEREEEEERERREAMLNDMMDVTKQKDLSGFYRHFLKQTVGEEKVPEFGEKYIKQEVVSDEEASNDKHSGETSKISRKDHESSSRKAPDVSEFSEELREKPENSDVDRDSENVEIDTESDEDDSSRQNSDGSIDRSHLTKRNEVTYQKKPKLSEKKKSRKYSDEDSSNEAIESRIARKRKRKGSCDHSGTDNDKSQSKKGTRLNQDSPEPSKNRKLKDSKTRNSAKDAKLKSKSKSARHDSDSSADEVEGEETVNNKENLDGSESQKRERKNIYAKRTVGDIFVQAQARYFQRMAARSS